MNKPMTEKFNMVQKTCVNEFSAQKDFLQDRLSEQEKHMSDIVISEKEIREVCQKNRKRIPHVRILSHQS